MAYDFNKEQHLLQLIDKMLSGSQDVSDWTNEYTTRRLLGHKMSLLRIARELKDITSIRSVAKELYAGRNMEYYKIIKQTYNVQEWPAIAEDFIKDIQKLNKPIPGFRGTINGESLASVFIEEGYWKRLLKLLQQNPRLEFIESYSGLLTDKFPEEPGTVAGEGDPASEAVS